MDRRRKEGCRVEERRLESGLRCAFFCLKREVDCWVVAEVDPVVEDSEGRREDSGRHRPA